MNLMRKVSKKLLKYPVFKRQYGKYRSTSVAYSAGKILEVSFNAPELRSKIVINRVCEDKLNEIVKIFNRYIL